MGWTFLRSSIIRDSGISMVTAKFIPNTGTWSGVMTSNGANVKMSRERLKKGLEAEVPITLRKLA